MKHYEDLIDRLRTATKLPLLQALMNEAADAIDALAADRRCAVPVPAHGRLIDADALLSQYNDNIWTAWTDYAKGLRDVVKNIEDAPTIIPASEEGE